MCLGPGDLEILDLLPSSPSPEALRKTRLQPSPHQRPGREISSLKSFLFKENMDMEITPLPPPPTCLVFFAQVSVGLGCQVRPPFDLSKYGARFSKQSCVGCWAEFKKEPLFP